MIYGELIYVKNDEVVYAEMIDVTEISNSFRIENAKTEILYKGKSYSGKGIKSLRIPGKYVKVEGIYFDGSVYRYQECGGFISPLIIDAYDDRTRMVVVSIDADTREIIKYPW